MKRHGQGASSSTRRRRSMKKKKPIPSSTNDLADSSQLFSDLFAKAVLLNHSVEFPILLNDKHASKYSQGSSVWLEAKRKERTEVELNITSRRCSLSERIERVTEIFKQELDLPTDHFPHFWYKLDENDIKNELRSQRVGKMEGYGNLYVECSVEDEKVRNNIKSFRLSKTPTRSDAQKRLSFSDYSSTPARRHASKLQGGANQNPCTTPAHSTTYSIPLRGLYSSTPSSLSSEIHLSSSKAPVVSPENVSAENTGSVTTAVTLDTRKCRDVQTGNSRDCNSLRSDVHVDHGVLPTEDSNEMSVSGSCQCDAEKSWDPDITLKLTSGKLLESLTKHSSLSTEDAMKVVMSGFPDAFPSEKGQDSFPISPIERRQIIHPPAPDDGRDDLVGENCTRSKSKFIASSEDRAHLFDFTKELNLSADSHLLDTSNDLMDYIQNVSPIRI